MELAGDLERDLEGDLEGNLEGDPDGGKWVCLEVNLPSYGSKDERDEIKNKLDKI